MLVIFQLSLIWYLPYSCATISSTILCCCPSQFCGIAIILYIFYHYLVQSCVVAIVLYIFSDIAIISYCHYFYNLVLLPLSCTYSVILPLSHIIYNFKELMLTFYPFCRRLTHVVAICKILCCCHYLVQSCVVAIILYNLVMLPLT